VSESVSQPLSQFTIERLEALFDAAGVCYDRAEGEPSLYLRHGCDRVPHELRLTVSPELGYCAIYQHDIGLFAPALAEPARLGEACRLALLLNGAMLFGAFMLYRFGGHSLSFGTVLPTGAAELSFAQIMQAVSCVCAEVDRCYPLLQAVLWGGLSAEEALARYQAGFDHGDNGPDGDGGPDDGGPGGPEDGPKLEAAVLDPEAIDRIDAAFLREYTPPTLSAPPPRRRSGRGAGRQAKRRMRLQGSAIPDRLGVTVRRPQPLATSLGLGLCAHEIAGLCLFDLAGAAAFVSLHGDECRPDPALLDCSIAPRPGGRRP